MAKSKKTRPTTIDEKAQERREQIQERTEKNVPNTKQVEQEEDVQPKFTEDGVKIEQNVFPPADENAEFYGTAAAQRELRRVKDENKKED